MIIRILKDLNINISWNMIFIGLCTGDVEAYEVIDYAMEQIELGDCRSEKRGEISFIVLQRIYGKAFPMMNF